MITETKAGVILEVYVKPKSKKFEIVVENGEIIVYCREEPVKGKVNRELIKELSKIFGRKVEFVSGFTSKSKIFLIKDACKRDVEKILFKR